jgi:uncharacterized protein
MQYLTRNLVMLILASFVSSISFAASFDCDKASSRIEKLICTDPDLSQLDESLLFNYKLLLSSAGETDTSSVKNNQRSWLKYRNSNCHSAYQCIVTYAERIRELKVLTDRNLLLASLADIKTANQLIWNEYFVKLRSEFFEGNEQYLTKKKLELTDAGFRELMSGAPEYYIDTTDYVIAMSCRHQSCDEKGIVAINKHNADFVFGAIHYIDENGKLDISNPLMTFFFKDKKFFGEVRDALIGVLPESVSISHFREVKM